MDGRKEGRKWKEGIGILYYISKFNDKYCILVKIIYYIIVEIISF